MLYLDKFDGDISKTHSDWGTFGDFISGTIGTLFNLLAVVFSLFSIYITLKIAVRIHENEQKFNINNSEREKEKFDREIELTVKQNKPYPVLEFNNLIDKSEIILLNQGPGTLIVTKIKIYYDDKPYNNFIELVSDKITNMEYNDVIIQFDSAKKYIVNSGNSKSLFEVNAISTPKNLFDKYRKECKVILKKTIVKLEYEDIFENKFEIEESLEF